MVYKKRNKVYLKKAEFLNDRVYVKQNKTNLKNPSSVILTKEQPK